MAKLANLPGQAIISGFKGTVDFYVWLGIPVARAWPRSPGKKRAVAVEEQWPVFSAAAQLWLQLPDYIQDRYKHMASGSTMSGRDLAAKMYINGHTIIKNPHVPPP